VGVKWRFLRSCVYHFTKKEKSLHIERFFLTFETGFLGKRLFWQEGRREKLGKVSNLVEFCPFGSKTRRACQLRWRGETGKCGAKKFNSVTKSSYRHAMRFMRPLLLGGLF
jgi:hypothetical protein